MTKKTKRKATTVKKWWVSIPITGSMSIEVEALHEGAAIDKAWELYNGNGPGAFELAWEATSCVCDGNVSNAELNEDCAEECSKGPVS